MTTTARRIPLGLCVGLTIFTLPATAQQQMPRTTKESVAGAPTVKTEQLNGTVVFVEGNRLVVRMSTGGVRTFDVPASRRFIVDGKELTVQELKTGTRLAATITTTMTPVTERTTTIGSGKVWWVSGNSVIVTLPNNENRMFKVAENYRFNVNGTKASVHDLKKGMVIAAEKIVEEPRTEVAFNTVVTGEAPPPPTRVAEAPAPSPVRPKPSAFSTPAPAPQRAEVTQPAEVTHRAEVTQRAEATPPATLPKTGSELPLFGLAGLLWIAASLIVRSLRRFLTVPTRDRPTS